MMTDEQRRTAIKTLIKRHTAAKTVSRAIARKSLIEEGIYTQRGKLRAEFGGKPGTSRRKAKTAA